MVTSVMTSLMTSVARSLIRDDVVNVSNDVINDVESKVALYAQVTARFVHFQENGKKLDTEINQSQNSEQEINVKNERNHIHVRNVNTKTLEMRSDTPLQNVQGIEPSLKTQLDGINVMNDNVKNERNHIHVRNVNTKTLETRSDKPLQNVQGIEP